LERLVCGTQTGAIRRHRAAAPVRIASILASLRLNIVGLEADHANSEKPD